MSTIKLTKEQKDLIEGIQDDVYVALNRGTESNILGDHEKLALLYFLFMDIGLQIVRIDGDLFIDKVRELSTFIIENAIEHGDEELAIKSKGVMDVIKGREGKRTETQLN